MCEDGVGPELRRLSNRLRLGQRPVEAVNALDGVLEEDAAALAAVIAVVSRTGGDAARMVNGVADSARLRDELRATANSYGAGARLSARMVAGLPLAFVPLSPMSRAPLADPVALLLLVIGLGLAVGGLAWVSALFPRPQPHDDHAAAFADLLASSLDAGAGVTETVREVCSFPPPGLEGPVPRVAGLLDLGLPWMDALAGTRDEGLVRLSVTIRGAGALGLPIASSLRSFAAARRKERAAEFEAAVRRAPVRMAVPLAICVLPAYVILGIAPFLRGLSLGV